VNEVNKSQLFFVRLENPCYNDFDSGFESSWPPKIKHNININSSISQKLDNPVVIINTVKTTPGIQNVRNLSFRWLGNK
jgi:hypothetical protein